MYCVELKDTWTKLYSKQNLSVSNVPCGVESKEGSAGRTTSWVVPNVPCGVERLFSDWQTVIILFQLSVGIWFLI